MKFVIDFYFYSFSLVFCFPTQVCEPCFIFTSKRDLLLYALAIVKNWHISHYSNKSWISTSKGKAVPLQAWSGPEFSRKLRFPDYMTTAKDGGNVSPMHGPPLPPGNAPGTHFDYYDLVLGITFLNGTENFLFFAELKSSMGHVKSSVQWVPS